MNPELKRLHDEISSVVAELSPKQLGWHPPGKWCAAEILEHLFLTYTGTTKGFLRMLESGRVQGNAPTLKQRAQAFLVVSLGYMPSGRKSPSVALPKGVGGEKVVAEIAARLAEMDQALAGCEAKFGSRAKVLDHPILGPFSVAQWRKFHLVHGLHHVKQIRRLHSDSAQL